MTTRGGIDAPCGRVDDRTVLGRTIAILDAVSDAVTPLPLALLTRRTGIPKPTVRRIANDLVMRGMLRHTGDGYAPGSRLIHQGMLSAHRHGIVAVQPHLQDLYLRTRGEMAWFATAHRGELVVANTAFGSQYTPAVQTPTFVRASRFGPSMVLSATGRIQVAHNAEWADRIVRGGWAPLTRYSVIDRRRLRRLLDEARDTGFAHEAEQAVLGLSCMAAALHDDSGQLVGAIGVTGRSRAIEVQGVRAALLRSAELLRMQPPFAASRPLQLADRERASA